MAKKEKPTKKTDDASENSSSAASSFLSGTWSVVSTVADKAVNSTAGFYENQLDKRGLLPENEKAAKLVTRGMAAATFVGAGYAVAPVASAVGVVATGVSWISPAAGGLVSLFNVGASATAGAVASGGALGAGKQIVETGLEVVGDGYNYLMGDDDTEANKQPDASTSQEKAQDTEAKDDTTSQRCRPANTTTSTDGCPKAKRARAMRSRTKATPTK